MTHINISLFVKIHKIHANNYKIIRKKLERNREKLGKKLEQQENLCR